MNKVKIKYNNNLYEYYEGATLLDISKKFANDYKYEIIIGEIDGDMYELSQTVDKDCEVKFYDLTSQIGNKVYERGLIFLFISAVKEMLKKDVKVSHSIDKGIYCEILGDYSITETDIVNVKNKIKEYIDNKISFSKILTSRLSAMNYYDSSKQYDKSKALKYIIRNNILMYRFNGMFDYFFGEMPIDSSYIKYFDISYINSNSVVLLFPNIYIEGNIKTYEHPDKVFDAFRKFSDWGKTQGIDNVSDLNDFITSGKIQELIYISESNQNKRLFDIADSIYNNKNLKMILIAGPSSSGKTTTAMKLKAYLKSMGLKPHTISIDDYFLNRDETPKDAEGNYDFESVRAIDVNLFNDHLTKLLDGEEVVMPTFNFIKGEKVFNKKLKLEKCGILIIEGLHALNDELTASINDENKYRIYISPLTCINIDNHNRVTTSDLRLLRRMVRDNMSRGYNASKTLESWRLVRKGEEKYVFPYQNKNEVVFNSSLIYELGVLRIYAEPLLFSVKHDDPNYNEAVRLINLIRSALPISGENLPYDSILREFIGSNYFKIGDE